MTNAISTNNNAPTQGKSDKKQIIEMLLLSFYCENKPLAAKKACDLNKSTYLFDLSKSTSLYLIHNRKKGVDGSLRVGIARYGIDDKKLSFLLNGAIDKPTFLSNLFQIELEMVKNDKRCQPCLFSYPLFIEALWSLLDVVGFTYTED